MVSIIIWIQFATILLRFRALMTCYSLLLPRLGLLALLKSETAILDEECGVFDKGNPIDSGMSKSTLDDGPARFCLELTSFTFRASSFVLPTWKIKVKYNVNNCEIN